MNELLFVGFAIFLLLLNLLAFKMGKLYMYILIAIYTLLMNIFVIKQFKLFGLDVTGGNALYGAIFLLTDLFSEHYGRKEALRSVKIGFGVMLLFIVSTQVLLFFEPNQYDFSNESLNTIFTITPRILIGSLIAYAIAQTIDVHLFEALKKLTKDKFLFIRNNGSTLVSQLVDTLVFTSIGLTSFEFLPVEGVIPVDIFWEVVLFTYLVKLLVAVLDTPFLYLSKYIKPNK